MGAHLPDDSFQSKGLLLPGFEPGFPGAPVGALTADVPQIYTNLLSISAKNAAERRSNSSSVIRMGSPMLSFKTD